MQKNNQHLHGLHGYLQGYLQGKGRAVIGVCRACRDYRAPVRVNVHHAQYVHGINPSACNLSRVHTGAPMQAPQPLQTQALARLPLLHGYTYTPATPANKRNKRGTLMAGKPLRDSMPIVTAFIDELRDVFGKDAIDQQIRRSVVDELPGFWAQENGVEVGIRMQWRGEWVSGKDMCTAPMKKAESGGGK